MPDSFERFFRENERLLYRISRSYSKDRETARDSVMEAFMILYRKWDTVRTMDNPTGYAVRVAINQSLKAHNKVRMLTWVDPADHEDIPDEDSRHDIRLVEEDTRSEQLKILECAMKCLSPKSQSIIRLRTYEEMKFEDIARAMNENLSTVKSLYRRGIEKLSRLVQTELPGKGKRQGGSL